MDPELNVTYITLGGHVDLYRYRYLYFSIMFAAYVLILCWNSTVVYLIWVHECLHQPMYVFIAALLINSVLYSSAIYPKLLLDFLSEQPRVSYPACLLQWYVSFCLGSSEFYLLASMAYDRFVSICRPLRYQTIMRRSRVSAVLLLSWMVPAGQIAVPVILSAEQRLCRFTLRGVICSNMVYQLHCERSRVLSVYGAVALVNTAVLPLLFILFTYTKILVVCSRSGAAVRRRAAQTCLPHLMVLLSFSCFSTCNVLLVHLQTHFSKTLRLVLTLQIMMYHPLFNPIIYGLKVKEISKHLRRLFTSHKFSE